MKKKIALILSLLLTLSMFSACSSGSAPASNAPASPAATKSGEPRKLVISTWGLSEDKLWENVFTPFEKKYNCKIVLDIGNNGERVTKLKNNPNAEVDIVYLAESFSAQAITDGMFDKIDYTKISNYSKLNPKAKAVADQGYGPAYTLNRIGIAYNPEKLGFKIESWSDLWRPELKGKIAIPDITTTFGPHFLEICAKKAGVPLATDKGEAAFKELAALKPNVVKSYTKSSDLANMFASGEIVAAVTADFAFGAIAKAAPKVVMIDPKEGAYLNFNTINIYKNSKNKDLAMLFIDWALSADVQTKEAKDIQESPVNVDVKLTEAESKNLTYGDVIGKSNLLDYKVINPNMKDWTDKWNRTLS